MTVMNPFEISKEVEMRDETCAGQVLGRFVSSDDVYDQRSTKGTERVSAQTGFYSKEIYLPFNFGECRHNSTGTLNEP